LLDWMKATLGYSFLYVNSVARPGSQIDPAINPSQSPAFTGIPSTTLIGAAAPVFPGQSSDFWVHALTVGLELTY